MTQEQKILIKVQAQADQAIKEIASLNKQVKSLSTTSKKSGAQLRSLNAGLGKFKSTLIGVGAGIASFQGVKSVVSDFSEFEQQLIDVSKTTGFTGKDLKGLDDALIGLARNLHGVSIKELYSIAQTAGQLGIHGKKDIINFSDSIAKISVATNLTAQEAATDFAVLRNVLKEPISNVELLGSVMNRLSNDSEANSKQIVEYSQRIAAQGKIFGLTSDQIMALSATLVGVGSNAEAGGTAISSLMQRMVGNIAGFAKASKMSIKDFSDTLKNDPIKALEAFLTEMGKLDKFQQNDTFKKLKLNNVRLKAVIQLVSGAMGKLNKNLAIAHDEMGKNTSLTEEYNTQAHSLNSEFKDTSKELDILKKRLGGELQTSLKDLAETTIKFLQSIKGSDIKNFAEDLKVTFGALAGIAKILGVANDWLMPDIFTHKGAGLIDTFGRALNATGKNIDKIGADWNKLGGDLPKVGSAIKNLLTADYGHIGSAFDGLKASLVEANTGADEVSKKIDAISSKKPKVEVEVKTDKVDKAKDDVKKIAEVKPKISINNDEVTKQISDVATDISGLSTIEPVITTKVDSNVEKVVEETKALDGIETTSKNTVDTNVEEVAKKVQNLNSVHTVSQHTVRDNISKVIARINSLNNRNTQSTHTIYVRQVVTKAMGGIIENRLASGGTAYKRRRGQISGHDLAGKDDVFAKLTNGEFVQSVRAVDYYGRSFMDALNSRLIPKGVLGLASGGLAGFGTTGSAQTSTKTASTVNINLNIGDKQFKMQSDEQVASALADYLERSEF